MQLTATTFLSFCLVASNATSTHGKPDSTSKQEVKTSVCELAQRGEAANGERVRVGAVYTTDRLESSSITDPQCPLVIVDPFDSDEPNTDVASLSRFDHAVDGKFSDRTLRRFSFDITGKYVWRPHEKNHGAIYIEKVWSFKRLPK